MEGPYDKECGQLLEAEGGHWQIAFKDPRTEALQPQGAELGRPEQMSACSSPVSRGGPSQAGILVPAVQVPEQGAQHSLPKLLTADIGVVAVSQ